MAVAHNIWKPACTKSLAGNGTVTLSAKEAGIDRATAYAARHRSKKFAEQWDEAIERATDLLEGEARRRAAVGVQEPEYYKGAVVGHKVRYSDNLLMFLALVHESV